MSLYKGEQLIAGSGIPAGKVTVLYDSEITANGTYTLTDYPDKYDFIIISHGSGTGDWNKSVVITNKDIKRFKDTNNKFLADFGFSNSSNMLGGYFVGKQLYVLDLTAEKITGILGVRVGGVNAVTTDAITNSSSDDEVPTAKAVNDKVKENYSTDEVKTNKVWIDGKPIYRKVVNFGALPNSANKTVAHGITNLDRIVSYDILAQSTTGANSLKIVYVPNSVISGYITGTTVTITTTANMASSYTQTYATIEYTKTTDA